MLSMGTAFDRGLHVLTASIPRRHRLLGLLRRAPFGSIRFSRASCTNLPFSPPFPPPFPSCSLAWTVVGPACADTGMASVFLASCLHTGVQFRCAGGKIIAAFVDGCRCEGKCTSHCKRRSCYSLCLYIMTSPISKNDAVASCSAAWILFSFVV